MMTALHHVNKFPKNQRSLNHKFGRKKGVSSAFNSFRGDYGVIMVFCSGRIFANPGPENQEHKENNYDIIISFDFEGY